MDEPLVTIKYKLADGKRICMEVSIPVKELLEQSDRQIRSQRRQDRRYLVSADSIDELNDAAITVPQEDFADLVIRMDRYDTLNIAISHLSEVQRRRLRLRFFDGLTYRQIADIEGVGFKSVSRSIERALKTLGRSLVR